MKKILVLGRKDYGEKNDPARIAKQLGANVEAVTSLIYFEDLVVRINGTKRTISDFASGSDLASADLVIAFGWYADGTRSAKDLAFTVGLYLKEHGIPVWNTEMAQQRSTSKLSATWLLAQAGVAVPVTVFSMNAAALLAEAKTFPCILKDIAASRGRHNHLVGSVEELGQLLEDQSRRYMVQEYITNDFDLRVVCFGGNAQLVIKRQRQSDDTHLNNTSQGGRAEIVPLANLPGPIQTEVSQICQLFGRELAGVDYLVANDGSNRYICLEVNAIPQLTSGSFTDEKNRSLSHSVATALANSKKEDLK